MAERKVIATCEFHYERSTKNMHRFHEEAADGEEIIGTLYVRKARLDSQEKGKVYTPATIFVTIEA